MSKSATSVVCDAGPVIHLDELDCLHILRDFQRILIPQRVYDETEIHRPGALGRLGADAWEKATPNKTNDKTLDTICRMFSLDAGETEAMAVLSENPSYVFLTDDAAARIVAQRLTFKVHGTIGILIRAVRRNLLKPHDVVELLRSVPKRSTLYIKPSLLEEAVARVKTHYNM